MDLTFVLHDPAGIITSFLGNSHTDVDYDMGYRKACPLSRLLKAASLLTVR